MKKFWVIMLTLTLLVTVVGCGNTKVEETTTEAKNEASATGTEATETTEAEVAEEVSKEPITFWIYEGTSVEGEAIIEELMLDFTNKTGYEVNVVSIPKDDFSQKLAASTAIGENPDVGYMDQPLVAMYASSDSLMDVTEKMASDDTVTKEDFYQGAFETNLVGDKLYGLPLNHTTVAIFYNKDLVENVPSTWDEWLAESKRIYEANNGEVAAFEQMWGGGGGAWLFPAFVHNAGGAMVNADSTACTFAEEPGVEAVQLILDLYEYSPLEVRTASNAFANGLAAFKMSGPWEIGGFDDAGINYGVMLMPTKEGDTHYSNIGGENIVAFKDAKNPEGAWELMKYLSSAEVNSRFVKVTGNYPANINADIEEFISHPGYSVFFEQLKSAVARPRVINWIKINDDHIGAALDEILVAGADPAETLQAAQDNANAVFGEIVE